MSRVLVKCPVGRLEKQKIGGWRVCGELGMCRVRTLVKALRTIILARSSEDENLSDHNQAGCRIEVEFTEFSLQKHRIPTFRCEMLWSEKLLILAHCPSERP